MSTPKTLAASAVSGQVPPAGPQWLRGLSPPLAAPLGYDKPLCASLDGFTLHAATRAGALHLAGREALLRYVLRPPMAQQRIECVAGDREALRALVEPIPLPIPACDDVNFGSSASHSTAASLPRAAR